MSQNYGINLYKIENNPKNGKITKMTKLWSKYFYFEVMPFSFAPFTNNSGDFAFICKNKMDFTILVWDILGNQKQNFGAPEEGMVFRYLSPVISNKSQFSFSYTKKGSSQTLFVTSENVREGYIDLSLPKYIEDGFNEKQKRSIIQKGDFLINIVGASIGRAAQFNLKCKANMNQAAALVRVNDKRIRDKYLLIYLNSDKAQMMYNSMKSDTGRANLSLQDIGNLSINSITKETIIDLLS